MVFVRTVVMKQLERKNLNWRERLALAVAGIFFGIYGYGQLLRGRWIYTNSRGQDVTATFVMVLGLLFLVAAVFPWGRLHFLWEGGRSRRRRDG